MMSSTPQPASSKAQAQSSSKLPPRARHALNNQKYGTPLPITLPTQTSFFRSFIPSLSPKLDVNQVIGHWDPITASVWVTDQKGMETLFRKGFFGKGSLSRSEPSWRERRVGLLKGGDTLAAEQMREKRRLERKQFKIDRAQAMLDAAKKAEAIVAASRSGVAPLDEDRDVEEDEEEGADGDVSLVVDYEADGARADSPAPSMATTATTTPIDPLNLTSSTFLIRPTRPDANRNRGRNAFRRRPPAPNPQTPGAVPVPAPVVPVVEPEPEEDEEDLFDESLVEEMEHLQLCVEEAIFLSLGLGVLKVHDPLTDTFPPPGPALLSLLLPPPTPTPFPRSPEEASGPLLPDNPALVSYVAYHHFRSLGWVVKDGVKFCVDWLLYRRGPVFSHSAFGCVIIPVYTDTEDQKRSPYGEEDWYDERMSWKWMNTIIRVNALVQKNVIAVYVTIPALSDFPSHKKLADGSLDPRKTDLKALLEKFTVREVALTRFGATRRRD